MDVDALASTHRAEWQRLDALSRRARLSGAHVDELVTRYRAASADLADIKTAAGRSAAADYLSVVLARARRRLTRRRIGGSAGAFFARRLPAALYRVRWTALAVAGWFFLVGTLVALWVVSDPAVVAALGDRAGLEQYALEDFVAYYRDDPAALFAGTVWTNNAWIAAQCVLFGVTGFWPVMVVMQNAVGVGQAAGIMAEFGRLDVFAQFIAPHGLLELTCVFVAAAAGLHIFWAWVAPGPRSRGTALAQEGRSLATVAIGLVFALALSGVVEGFVTPQSWPWPVKVAIGAAAWGVFLVYMLVAGRRAAVAGETGDLSEDEVGATTLVAG